MKTATRQENPGERADRLAADGYTLRRTDTLGVYLLTKPDKSREYRVDVNRWECNCLASSACKHLGFCYRYFQYDRAQAGLARERARNGVLVQEWESEFLAAEAVLASVLARTCGAVANERAA